MLARLHADMTGEEWESALAKLVALPDPYLGFLAFTDAGEPIGMIDLRVRNYAEGAPGLSAPYVEDLWVEPEHRRQGVAGRLLQAAEQWARGEGYDWLGSDARFDNDGSHSWHRAAGFDETERTRRFRKSAHLAGAAPFPLHQSLPSFGKESFTVHSWSGICRNRTGGLMRVPAVFLILVASAPAIAGHPDGGFQVREPSGKGRAAAANPNAKCQGTTTYLANQTGLYRGQPLTPRKLTELPPAIGYMAVYRHIGDCEEPLTMVEYRNPRRR